MKGIFEGSFDRRTVRTAPAHVQGARLKAGAPLSWYRGYQRPDAGSIARALCAALLLLAVLSPAAHAACSSPTGAAGDQIYNSTHNVMQYCNGTNWIAMGSGGAGGGGSDTLGDLTCNSGESIEFDGTDWQCVGGKVSRAGDTLTGPLSGTTASFTGVVSGALPTANGHLATKEYVDTAIAGAAGGEQFMINCTGNGSTTNMCFRINTTTGQTECVRTNDSASTWTSCTSPMAGVAGGSGVDPNGITDGGFFVITAANWFGGDLGNLTGADAKCLTELQDHPWKGKGSAGTLTSTRVKAFLCNGTTCNNAQPYTRYSFARTRNTTNGGASFTTDASGRGPGDSAQWSDATYFGSGSYYFSNRDDGASDSLWTLVPEIGGSSAQNCNNWTSSVPGNQFYPGTIGNTDKRRWLDIPGIRSCNSNHPLVCMVHPEP